MINDKLLQEIWTGFWEFAACYHNYECEGMEHLDNGPVLIAGYHGRAIAADLCILSVKIKQRLGYLPHCFVHRTLLVLPGMQEAVKALGFLTHDDEVIATAIAKGEHILVPPGGAAEGMRTVHENYTVHWPTTGYAKLAARHGLPIVPVAAAGVDDTYIGLLNGEKMAGQLGLSRKWAWAPWTGLGPLGLYPFSPPFPARFFQVIGEPIETKGIDPDDPGDITVLHGRVVEAVQELLRYASCKTASGKKR